LDIALNELNDISELRLKWFHYLVQIVNQKERLT
jgi:hypothetical protein